MNLDFKTFFLAHSRKQRRIFTSDHHSEDGELLKSISEFVNFVNLDHKKRRFDHL